MTATERSVAILAGGRGVRLGPEMPKALRPLRGRSLLERAVHLARAWSDDVIVCIPAGLTAEVAGTRTVRDPTAFGPWPGPLVTLAWALEQVHHPWALVLAVDMPLIRPQLLDLLWRRRTDPATAAPDTPGHAAALGVVPWRQGRPEPLLGLYRREAGPALLAMAHAGERAAVRAVPALPLVRLAESEWRALDPQGLSFENCNTPEEWERAEEILSLEEATGAKKHAP